jgi:hypothetical protein
MKKFLVKASYLTHCTLEIEAPSEDEAWEMAKGIDGENFDQSGLADWSIDSVSEVVPSAVPHENSSKA